MKKYLDNSSIVFGLGAIIGGLVFNMVVAPKLPASMGGSK